MNPEEQSPELVSAETWLSRAREAERRGELLAAYDVAIRGLAEHTDDVSLRYRAVLALARAGATARAGELYDAYGLAERTEEDVAALAARIAKDTALLATGGARAERAAEAARLYAAVYDRTATYFPGINAATMWLIAGEPAKAEKIASEVRDICAESDGGSSEDTYYLAVTEAEACLLLDDRAGAESALGRAASVHDGDFAAVATTRRQLRLICETKGVDPAVLAPLASPAVIHYCGHMIAPPGGGGRFAAEAEVSVAESTGATLEEKGVGFGYGSLASGADILFAEALLARGAELHVVLPFNVDEFKYASVAAGGSAWPERFTRCLERATSVSYATEDSYLGDDSLFTYAARLAMGLAMLRSQYLDTTVEQIAVWDGKPAAGDAGTAIDVAFWRDRGLPCEIIDPGSAAAGAETEPGGGEVARATPQRRVVRAMLFGDVKGFSKMRESQLPVFVTNVLGRFGAVLDGYGKDVLFRNTWGDGIFVVLPDAGLAARCASDLQTAMQDLDLESVGLPPHLALRLGAHVGPVFEVDDPVLKVANFFGEHVSRTARIEPVTPEDDIYVTEPFAAQLALDKDTPLSGEYVGHMPAAKGYGEFRMYALTRRG